MRTPKKKKASFNHTEHKMVKNLDDLAEFEKFREEFLPSIRKDLYSKKSAKQILEKYTPLAAARKAMALVSPNEDIAIRAATHILDRTEGKPKEKIEHTYKYESLSEEELRSKLLSLEAENTQMEKKH